MTSAAVVFDEAWVARFAKASRDVNPLHVDAAYARGTSHGRPIVHGVLGACAVLAQVPAEWLTAAADVRIRFRHAVFPDTRYDVCADERGAAAAKAVLRLGGMELLSLTVTRQAANAEGLPSALDGACADAPELEREMGAPRVLTHANMAVLGPESGSYRPDMDGLRRLCDELGGAAVPNGLLGALAWASYWTGMCTPGRDALLAGVRLRLRPNACVTIGGQALRYAVAPPVFDRRTGACELAARLDGANGCVDITIDSILRRPVPQATCAAIGREIEPTDCLAGRRLMVAGGTRGLGRGIALALAQQGAEVVVVHRGHSQASLEDMRKDLGSAGDRLVACCCDAGDARALAEALREIPSLDGLVLAPAPAIPALPLDAAAMAQAIGYVERSLQLAWAPLAVCTERLLPDGASIVMLSSAAVEEPPALWPHYVAAKMALEGLARYCASQRRWRVAIARPPRLWTDLTNAATGHIGTVSIERVAARIAEHIVADARGPRQRPWSGEVAVLDTESLSAATGA